MEVSRGILDLVEASVVVGWDSEDPGFLRQRGCFVVGGLGGSQDGRVAGCNGFAADHEARLCRKVEEGK